LRVFSGAALLLGVGAMTGVPAHAAQSANVPASSSSTTPARGELDCNGFSTVQKELRANLCTDISGHIKGAYDGKYYDNGRYIGHDEPDTTFLSSAPGSGGNVTWTETLGRDPRGTPAGPGGFYPYWTKVQAGAGFCALEFGNVSAGFLLNTYGKDAQYGTNQFSTLGYPEFEGPVHNNTCKR
jgi:hypothetical protein